MSLVESFNVHPISFTKMDCRRRSISPSSLTNDSFSLVDRFTKTDYALRDIAAILAYKTESWNSVFGGQANFMDHLKVLR